jgi:general secretion pathway protein H
MRSRKLKHFKICHFEFATDDLPKRGFTLLELMVTLFLLSLIVAIVFPSFYGLEERRLKSEARTVASVLRYLHDSGISTKETYFLKFDLKEHVVSWEEPDGKKTETFKSLAGLNLQSRGEVKEGQITLFFGPSGVQENITVYLRDEDQRMRVTLNSVSGRVKIFQDAK